MQSLVTLLHGMPWGWNLWTVVSLLSDVLALLTAPSILLRRRGQPLPALGWLLAVFALPLLGAGWWWLVGRSRLERRRRRRRAARVNLCAAVPGVDDGRLECCEPSGEAGAPPWRGCSDVRLVVDGEEVYAALDELIAAAVSSLEVMFYIWRDDATGRRFRDHLAARAAEGVVVRVLVDAVGSAGLPRSFWWPLEEAGGHVAQFQPPRLLRRGFDLNFRNHRKLVVCDATAAWVGGLNIGEEHLGAWHDMGVVLSGGGVVDLREVFLDDWFFATGDAGLAAPHAAGSGRARAPGNPEDLSPARVRALASGPDELDNSTRAWLFDHIGLAMSRVWVLTPYFAPDPAMLEALTGAARRGLDVRVVLPASGYTLGDRIACLASRSFWEPLLRVGARLHLYRDGFSHAKAVLIDEVAYVGSANLDERSLRLNFELGVVVEGGRFVDDLEATLERDFASARELDVAIAKSSPAERLLSSAAHLFSPLL